MILIPLRGSGFGQNHKDCIPIPESSAMFERALRLEASLQLSEGVNMARRTTVMNVDLEGKEEINLIKVQEPDQMPVINAVMWHTFSETVSMMVISQLIINRHRMDNHLQNLMTQW